MNRKPKHIIVIGAGVAGLSAAIYARKLGYATDLYEKNPIPGGECTGWDRGGCHIDNCIHWLIGTAPGTELNNLYRETRLLDERTDIYRYPVMYTSYMGGEHVSLYPNIEQTRKEWKALSPQDSGEIDALMDASRLGMDICIPAGLPGEMLGAINGTKLLLASRSMFSLMKRYKGMSTQDLVDRFKHPLLKACISDFCPKESKAESFATMYGNYAGGDGGVPVGGSQKAARRMQERFAKLGGVYHGASPVTRIVVENGKATGIVLSDGSFVPADYIIPACDADFTFSHLLDASYMPQKIREYFDNPKKYVIYGMFQAAWLVDSPQAPFGIEAMIDVPELKTESWLNDRLTLKCYAYEPSFAPPGKQIVQVLWGCSHDAWKFWENLSEEAYKTKKNELAHAVQAMIEQRFPAYSGKLTLLDSWTNRTYAKWCNAHDGYNQACIMTKETDPRKDYPTPYLKNLSNVVLAGQWMSPPGGIPGSCVSGKFAAIRVDHLAHRKRDAAKKLLFRYVLPAAVIILLIRLCSLLPPA